MHNDGVLQRSHITFRWLAVIVLAWGCLYCGLNLTPSSYGVTLKSFKSTEKPLIGVPQPIRSDEYTVITPLFQITINNHFKRYNATSPYGEDLRPFIILPLKDWALPFKPATWMFYVAPPAFAYSFYYYFYFALFVLGYFSLFQKIGLPSSFALLASFLTYSCGFTQYWYTMLIGQLAWFPWTVLAWQRQGNPWLRSLAIFYVTGALLFSSMYSVGAMPLAYAGFWIFVAFFYRRVTWPSILTGIIVSLLAAAVFFFYNEENFLIMARTIYPGQRSVGGGSLPLGVLLSHIFPSIDIIGYKNLIGPNLCEIGTYGSYLALAMLFFAKNWRRALAVIPKDRAALLLLFGIIPLVLWMIVPIPKEFMRLLLMDKMFPERWLFALGLLWHVFLLSLFIQLSFNISNRRIAAFAACILLVSFLAKALWVKEADSYLVFLFAWQDYAVIGTLIFLRILLPLGQKNSAFLLLGAVTLSNAVTFDFFNPWQSAKPIFSPPQTDYLKSLVNNPVNFTPEGYYAGPLIGIGDTENGLGLRSLAHLQMTPNLAFFYKLFGGCLSPADMNMIFNRYAHIILYNKDPKDPYYNWIGRSSYLLPYRFNAGGAPWTIYVPDSTHQPGDTIFLPRDYVKHPTCPVVM